MIEVPANGEEPRIRIYENKEELERETGMKTVHGYFDPKENIIIATLDTVAHEVGHYLDFKHGGLKIAAQLKDPIERSQAKMRNEIVAILYAHKKLGGKGKYLPHEVDFLEWLYFMKSQKKDFGPHAEIPYEKLSVSQIQEIANWVVLSEHEWFQKLEHIFRAYLQEENMALTYRY